jgi:transposase
VGTRRQFSREFKLEAVKLVKERGVAIVQAERDLDIHQMKLRAWIRELADDPQEAFPGDRPFMQAPRRTAWWRVRRAVPWPTMPAA